MDLTIYVESIGVGNSNIPTNIGFATFELMGQDKPKVELWASLDPRFASHLKLLMQSAERVWVGPNIEAALQLWVFMNYDHPKLRDAETLFEFVPHLPYEYPVGATASDNARTMAVRIRSCIDALITSGL